MMPYRCLTWEAAAPTQSNTCMSVAVGVHLSSIRDDTVLRVGPRGAAGPFRYPLIRSGQWVSPQNLHGRVTGTSIAFVTVDRNGDPFLDIVVAGLNGVEQ